MRVLRMVVKAPPRGFLLYARGALDTGFSLSCAIISLYFDHGENS